MKTIRKGISLFFLLVLVTGTVFADSLPTEAQIHKVYERWTQAIARAKGNPQPVVALYSPDTILLATLSPLPLTTRSQLNDYFTKLTRNKDLTVETKQILTQIYPHIAINSGVYIFHFIDKNNKPVALTARFSFVYHESNGQWLIVNHHSSLMPKAVP